MCGEGNATVSSEDVDRVCEVVHTVVIPKDDGSGEDCIRFVEGAGGELLAIANGLMRDCYGYTTSINQLQSVVPSSVRDGYERFDVIIPDVDPAAPEFPGVTPTIRKAIGLTELGFVDLSRKRSKFEKDSVTRVYRALRDDRFVCERWKVVCDHELDDDFGSMFPGVREFSDETETSPFTVNLTSDVHVVRKTQRSEADFGNVLLMNLAIPGNKDFWGVSWSSLQVYFNYGANPVLDHWVNGRDYVIVRTDEYRPVDFILRGECLVYNVRSRRSAVRGDALLSQLLQSDENWGELLGLEDGSGDQRAIAPAAGEPSVKSYTYVPEGGEPYKVNLVFLEGHGFIVSLADMRKALDYESHVPLNGMRISIDYVNIAPVPGLNGTKRFLTRSGYERAYARRVKSDESKTGVQRFDEWFWRTVAPEVGWKLPERWSVTSDANPTVLSDAGTGVAEDAPECGTEGSSEGQGETRGVQAVIDFPDDLSTVKSASPVAEVEPVSPASDVGGVSDMSPVVPVEVPEGPAVVEDRTGPDVETAVEVDVGETESESEPGEVPVGVEAQALEGDSVLDDSALVRHEVQTSETPGLEPFATFGPPNVVSLPYDDGRVHVRFSCSQGVLFAAEEDFLILVGDSATARETVGKLSDYEYGERDFDGNRIRSIAEFGLYKVIDAIRFHSRIDGMGTFEIDAVSRWLSMEAIPTARTRLAEVPPISQSYEGFVGSMFRSLVEHERQLSRQVAKTHDESEVLRKQVQDLQGANSGLQGHIKTLKEVVNDLRGTEQSLLKQVQNLQDEILVLQDENRNLKVENRDLQKRNLEEHNKNVQLVNQVNEFNRKSAGSEEES